MKYFLIILLFFCFSLTGCSDNSISKQEQNNNYSASRITTSDNTTTVNNTDTNLEATNENVDNVNTEIELSSFSTKIYTPNDEARQNNIRITCSKLDGTIVKSR